jgi:CubicO group peptidase (beta-lactamase class C family)
VRRPALIVLLAILIAGAVLASRLRPAVAMGVGAGFVARVVCGLVYNTGLDPEVARRDYVDHVIGPASALISMEVRRADRAVDATSAGLVSARAVHRDGLGCVLVLDGDEARLRAQRDPPHAPPLPRDRPWPRGDAPLTAPPPPALAAALDAAFAEPEGTPGRLRQTHAVLVAHRGRLVAERYAEGIDAATPLLSWSAAKSVTAALIGVAAHEGWLTIDAPAPVPEWRGEGDPRGRITVDQLLRMSSGLAFDEHYGAVNDVSRMLFTEPDTGAFAASFPLAHEPDTHWAYSSGTSNILARVLRDRFDGDVGAMVRWSREALFAPAAMRSVIFETDTSGSFVGSSLMYATARDWARFGQLFLDDGVTDGRRLLPEGFARYVGTPTPAAPRGRYGAGWWTNGGDPDRPEDRPWPGVPRDAFAARGMSGQYVVVIPSADLVVVRLGLAQAEGDALHGIEPLLRTAVEVLAGGAAPR